MLIISANLFLVHNIYFNIFAAKCYLTHVTREWKTCAAIFRT
jgi:hypothetical protein